MKREELFRRLWVVLLCCFVACTLWGSAFPCIKTGYRLFQVESGDYSSQILFAGVRFFLAGLLVVAGGSIIGRKLLIPKRESLWKIVVLSMAQTSVQYALFYIGLGHTSAVNGSIIAGTGGLITLLVGAMVFRSDKLTPRKLFGCALGFGGVIAVNVTGDMEFSMHFLGDGLLLVSSLCSALASVFMKSYSRSENPVMLTGYQFALGGFVLMILGGALGGGLSWAGAAGVILVIYMALISAVAFTLWSILLKYNDISRIAVFKFIIPIMGVLLSGLFLPGVVIGGNCIFALALVVCGIIVVNLKIGRNKP